MLTHSGNGSDRAANRPSLFSPSRRLCWGRLFLALCLASIGLSLGVGAARAAARPNIVIILADDLGYGDLGCFGCKDIPTPNIDSLARDGARFTDAHAYQVCSPTRAALLTGRYAEHNGVKNVLMGGDAPSFAKEVTIAEMLKQGGYTTGLVGKWHVGYSTALTPLHKGFDEFFGFRGGKIDYYKYTDTTQKNGTPEGKHDLWEGDKEVFTEGYATDLFTERARKFIRSHADKPFFLLLAYNAPHIAKKDVLQAPDTYLKKFGAEGKVEGRGVYAATVNCMDDGVGQVLAELKAQRIETNTLVIFLSDNGAEGDGSNAPLSGKKHQLKEGGIRVPMVARWPGVIPAGIERKDVVHVIDVAPTCLALSGVAAPPGVKLDGVNIAPALEGKAPVPDRPIYYGRRVVREGKWKLLDGKLYDLEKDLKETTDVAAENRAVADRLSALLEKWIEPQSTREDGK